ncbi:hypothetical protein V2J09_004309 [Rumex salicifolius]
MVLGIAAPPPFSGTVNHTHVVCLSSSASSLLLPASKRHSLTACTFSSKSSQLRKKKAWTGVVRTKSQVEDDTDGEACELVNGTELTIGDGNDSIHAHLFHAVKNNNGTGILLISDIFGFQDSSTRDFAYRTACNGYKYAYYDMTNSVFTFVLVPDLFRGNPWRHDQPWSMFEKWLATQDAERVARDIEACTKWMVEEFLAAGISSKIGIIGFCYGGRLVIDVLARDYGSCFGTGVSFYGTRMDNSVASDVKVPVLFITGDKDPHCPVDGLRELAQTVGDDSKVVVFNGRGHGFAHRPQSNEEDTDAEEAFLTMRHWLHDHLVQSVL